MGTKSGWLLLTAGVTDDAMYGRARRCSASLRLLLECSGPPQLHVLPSSSLSAGSSVIRWTRIRRVPRPCIRPLVRIRSRCIRCTRTAAGCFTDSTIATGYSTIGAPDRFRSDSTVSSPAFSTERTVRLQSHRKKWGMNCDPYSIAFNIFRGVKFNLHIIYLKTSVIYIVKIVQRKGNDSIIEDASASGVNLFQDIPYLSIII